MDWLNGHVSIAKGNHGCSWHPCWQWTVSLALTISTHRLCNTLLSSVYDILLYCFNDPHCKTQILTGMDTIVHTNNKITYTFNCIKKKEKRKRKKILYIIVYTGFVINSIIIVIIKLYIETFLLSYFGNLFVYIYYLWDDFECIELILFIYFIIYSI